MDELSHVIEGAIVVFYKVENQQNLYLVVRNRKTGNVTLMSGATEESDPSTLETAQREIHEELELDPGQYQLTPTAIRHDFVFGPNKIERAGQKGSYQVFLCDLTHLEQEFEENTEIHGADWMTKNEVCEVLSFPDLKEVFLKAVREVEHVRESQEHAQETRMGKK